MECCICGQRAKGKQWHNRDTGFGICADCAIMEREKLDEAQMKSYYGTDGVHYFTARKMPRADEKPADIKEKQKTYEYMPSLEGTTQAERDEIFKQFRRGQDEMMFVMTRDGSLGDLKYVSNKVLEEFKGKVHEAYYTDIIRKGRRDVYITTSDNILFRDTYNRVLVREQQLYENKGEK